MFLLNERVWKSSEEEQLLHTAEFEDKHSMSMHLISFTHALAWGLRAAHILNQPSQSKRTMSAGKACRNSLLVMPHSWVSGFLKARGTHLALAKKGNKKSRLTRSRKGMLFFFFWANQHLFQFSQTTCWSTSLSSSTLHFVFTLSSFCDKNNVIPNPEVSRVSLAAKRTELQTQSKNLLDIFWQEAYAHSFKKK